MREAITKHLRDFVALTVLVVLGLGIALYVVHEQRLRIPILQEPPFELKAEFGTAQAVVPGQGQTIRVAGVKVGDVEDVELDEGVGVVTFAIDREYLPIYRDAMVLMRPTTGLKDMFFQLDPGTRAAGEYEEGGTIPVANTAPDVNLDEVLEALDADTQAYLRLLLVGAGKGLDGRDRELGRLLGSIGPINRDFARLNRLVAQRRGNLARLIHNLNRLTTRVGDAERDLTELVAASESSLGAIAVHDPDVERAVSLLPGTLRQARETLAEVTEFAELLGPTFDDLRPFARKLPALNESVTELATEAAPVIENEIRPFVRATRPVVPDLRRAATRFADAGPGLTTIGRKINRLANMAAYNPNGSEPVGTPGRDEGYLYWVAWLSNNGNNVYSAGDAHGHFRGIYLTMGCDQVLNLINSPEGGALPDEVGAATGLLNQVVHGLSPAIPGLFDTLGCEVPEQ
ncbi:MAG TPA: MlaD family protein [Solirubrobacterales bacterium]|nr:MlaD family protein [Solirubrobacterales bacterium]